MYIKKTVLLHKQQFLLTPMGVLAPGSAQETPSAQPPIDMSGHFSEHMSAESLSKFSKKYLENPKNHPQGVGEKGSEFFLPELLLFSFGAHATI
jgi:hypothetical protein